ncbi:NUF2 protein, partial [Probosciger aterrimus]|nr:NUF2 protein [Probosciger aterrimus]
LNMGVMYPQIFEGFLPFFFFYIHMERLLPVCQINDFQIADVLNPKTKRTVRFLSGILNFMHFRESRREVYLELQQNYKSAMEKHQQLETVNREATAKLEKLNTVPVEHQAEFFFFSDNIRELEQLLRQDYRRKQTLVFFFLQFLFVHLVANIESMFLFFFFELKVTMATLKEEQEQLKSKIVESPEELKNYKEMMKETVKKLKRSKQEVIEKYEGYIFFFLVLPSCQ